MAEPDSERGPGAERLGPTRGETARDSISLLLFAGTALLAVGGVLAALGGRYLTAVSNGAVAVVLAYAYRRFGRNRRRSDVRNLNL